MISNFILLTKKHSTLTKNAISLYLIQASDFIIPLLTIPYLFRIIGVEKVGVIGFSQSLISYFIVVVEYGFNYSATRTISVHKEDTNVINLVASNVLIIKSTLAVFCLGILILLTIIVPRIDQYEVILYILYGGVIGNVLFPIWLFQGMEKMVVFSSINMTVKILSTVLIFALIKNPSDFIIYAYILGLSGLLAGLIGLIYAFIIFKISIRLSSIKDILDELRNGWTLFLSTASISIYTTGNAFILGLFTNNLQVGYYTGAEKIVRAGTAVLIPISQTTYPRFSKIASESKEKALYWGKKMLAGMGMIGLSISITLLLLAPYLAKLVLGVSNNQTILLIRIMSALPLIISISNVLGMQLMIPLGKDKIFTKILVFAGFINLLVALILVPRIGSVGSALSFLASELTVTSIMMFHIWKYELKQLKK